MVHFAILHMPESFFPVNSLLTCINSSNHLFWYLTNYGEILRNWLINNINYDWPIVLSVFGMFKIFDIKFLNIFVLFWMFLFLTDWKPVLFQSEHFVFILNLFFQFLFPSILFEYKILILNDIYSIHFVYFMFFTTFM